MNMPLLTLPVVIKPPFKLDDINPEHGQADFYTSDDEYCLEIKFKAHYFKNSDDFQSWKDTDIEELCDIKAYNEDGPLEYFYINPLNLELLKESIEKAVWERMI